MNIIIHRGTDQIGGCITEINTAHARIFIDMGEELPGAVSRDNFQIDGVTTSPANCDGVFITHYHGDHVGLYKKVLPDVPIYMGEVAKEIFLALALRIKDGGEQKIRGFKTFKALDKITIKDIIVTPLLVDHSAFDAYMFLVESGGKRILHTGDFRLHGFRGKAVIPTLKKYVGTVDLLITEGTSLSREDQALLAEGELKMIAKSILGDHKYTFVLCASTNIDRIAAFYHATPRGKYFMCDDYQKSILDIVTKHAGKKTDLYDFKKALVYGDNLDERLQKRGFCMLVRSSDYFSSIIQKFSNAAFLYSMWEGYRHGKSRNEAIVNFTTHYDFKSLHTSGHASKSAIASVCDIVAPRIGVIPIHSDAPHNLDSLNLNYDILFLQDKETFSI